jgi:hypothetical protein
MRLKDAEEVARRLTAVMSPFCLRVEIAGSIRRSCPEVKDVELVAVPRWSERPAPVQSLFVEESERVNLLHEWAVSEAAGVPEDFVTYMRSLVGKAIEFYSCFISYSSKDEEFARRLHARMRQEGLRVWFAPEDIKGGQKLYEQIDRAIQLHDRLLIILSENSMRSEWVLTEIRRARKTEVKEGRRKLFPIRLVGYEEIGEWECFDADHGKELAVEVREYYIPDFSNWKNHDAFEREFGRLYKSLKAEA